jgi:threonyl-tRNA synthetase
MNLPNRFELSYIDANGKKAEPIMLHLACFGSIERFLGMYIETIEGKFPLWVNPVQCIILNINENVEDYCKQIYKKMKDNGIRAELDLDNKTLNSKIREHSLRKIPYIVIIGDKEKNNNAVSVRIFSSEKQINISVDEFINKINKKVEKKETGFELN